jgi:hypothetical protein
MIYKIARDARRYSPRWPAGRFVRARARARCRGNYRYSRSRVHYHGNEFAIAKEARKPVSLDSINGKTNGAAVVAER